MSGDEQQNCSVASLRLAAAITRGLRRPSEVGDDARRRCKILAADVFARSCFVDTPYTHGYTARFQTVDFCLSHATVSGGVAQLGERVNGIHEVRGSIPLASIAAEHPSTATW